jgi:hypothetical protein
MITETPGMNRLACWCAEIAALFGDLRCDSDGNKVLPFVSSAKTIAQARAKKPRNHPGELL